jgi:tellurite resistance protein
MGANGAKNFENDDAADWVYDLTESNGTEILAEAFAVIEKTDFADAPDCCIALAAAEVVAAAKGKPSSDLPDEIRTWLENQDHLDKFKKLDKRAAKVAKKVQAKSELRDQWEESDDWHNWQMAVEGLLKRLA